MNEVINGEDVAIDIQGFDIHKCFDEMNFFETHNALYDVTPKDDKFTLMTMLDVNCKVKVRTPCGITPQFQLDKVVPQGSVLAPLKCSVQIDTLARDSYSQDLGREMYRYKNCLYVPNLLMADDILSISACSQQSLDSIEQNAVINS